MRCDAEGVHLEGRNCVADEVEIDVSSFCDNNVHEEDGMCVADEVNVEDYCDAGTHASGGFCVADDVEMPDQVRCGQCTYLNEDETECLLDTECIENPPHPSTYCGLGTEWDDERKLCAGIGVLVNCWDTNYCVAQECSAPDPFRWEYSSTEEMPYCTNCENGQSRLPDPVCCVEIDFSAMRGGGCISDFFYPYDEETVLTCWNNGEVPEGCTISEFWTYDRNEYPHFECESGRVPVPEVSCCPMFMSDHLCATEEINPYHLPEEPDECEYHSDCFDENSCTYGSCSDGHCSQQTIPNNENCEGDRPGTINNDCVCWYKQATKYVCRDTRAQCRDHGCESPATWEYDPSSPAPNCECPEGMPTVPTEPICYHRDYYMPNRILDRVHNPYEHCIYDTQCTDPLPENDCVEALCRNGRCVPAYPTGSCGEHCYCSLGQEYQCIEDAHCVDDGNPCTIETCNTEAGCEAELVANGQNCDNGNEDCWCYDGEPSVFETEVTCYNNDQNCGQDESENCRSSVLGWTYVEGELPPRCICDDPELVAYPEPKCCLGKAPSKGGYCMGDHYNPYPKCWEDFMCNDDNPCTTDICFSNRYCLNESLPNGHPCGDDVANCMCRNSYPVDDITLFNVDLNENSPSGVIDAGEDYHSFILFDVFLENNAREVSVEITGFDLRVESNCDLYTYYLTNESSHVNVGVGVSEYQSPLFHVNVGSGQSGQNNYPDGYLTIRSSDSPVTFGFGAFTTRCHDDETIKVTLQRVYGRDGEVIVDEDDVYPGGIQGHTLTYELQCHYDEDCVDENPCTENSCFYGACQFWVKSPMETCIVDEVPEEMQDVDCYCMTNLESGEIEADYEGLSVLLNPSSPDGIVGPQHMQEAMRIDVHYYHPLGLVEEIGGFDFVIEGNCEGFSDVSLWRTNDYLVEDELEDDPANGEVFRLSPKQPHEISGSGWELQQFSVYMNTSLCRTNQTLQVRLLKVVDPQDNELISSGCPVNGGDLAY